MDESGTPANNRGSSGLSNLQQRILSAVVLGAIVLLLTWLGGAWFRCLIVAMGAAIFYEWAVMTDRGGRGALRLVAAGGLALTLLFLLLGATVESTLAVLAFATVLAFAHGAVTGQAAWTAAGLLYAGSSAVSLAFLRGADEAGLSAIVFLFAVVWATDIFAYFVGRALGGPRLAPAISPGKTWSGALGGALFGTIAGVIVAAAAGLPSLPLLGGLALVLSVVSQIGDLFESWTKRRHGVKDSGSIIPGHGGVMDRVDGLVAAAIVLYVVGWLAGSADQPALGLFSA